MGGSDELLALRAARGDRRAFDAIYRRYSQELHRFCLTMTGNPQDAQDVLQNTMVKALRALPGERREIKLKPWLYRVARNESIEARRRRPPGAELDSEAAELSGVAETVETRERLRSLLADLATLPERQRATLVMREMAGLGFADIALAFDVSQGAVRQTLYEARLRLRELERQREIDRGERAQVVDLPLGSHRPPHRTPEAASRKAAPAPASTAPTHSRIAHRAAVPGLDPSGGGEDASSVGRGLRAGAAPAPPAGSEGATPEGARAPIRSDEEKSVERMPVETADPERRVFEREAIAKPPGKPETTPGGPPDSLGRPEAPPGKPEAPPGQPEAPLGRTEGAPGHSPAAMVPWPTIASPHSSTAA